MLDYGMQLIGSIISWLSCDMVPNVMTSSQMEHHIHYDYVSQQSFYVLWKLCVWRDSKHREQDPAIKFFSSGHLKYDDKNHIFILKS